MKSYTHGIGLWEDRSLTNSLAAAVRFEQAIQEDPNFALAYAGLAGVQLTLMEHNFSSRPELLDKAQRYAEMAVSRDPSLAEAHTVLAAVKQYLWKWEEADKSYRDAIRLNPGYSMAQRWYAGLLVQFGQYEAAVQRARLALQLDPYNLGAQAGYGFVLTYAGRYKEAEEYLKRLVGRHDVVYAHRSLGTVYAKLASMAQGDEARGYLALALQQAHAVNAQERESLLLIAADQPGIATGMYAVIYALQRDESLAKQHLELMLRGYRRGTVPAEDVAAVYVALGDHNAALNILETGVRARQEGVLLMKVHPLLESLRNHSRFAPLVAEMRL